MLTIRNASPEDAPAIAAVKRAAAREAYSAFTAPEALETWLLKRADERFIAERIAQADTVYLVAERAGKLIGAGMVKPEVLSHSTPTGYLADLYVHPTGQGVGKKLLQELVYQARGRWLSLRCFALGGNQVAVDFFTRHGFAEVARTPNQELPGELVELSRRFLV